MYYQINVSRYGHHLFATADNSLLTKEEAQSLFQDFEEWFPKQEGFTITVYECNTICKTLWTNNEKEG